MVYKASGPDIDTNSFNYNEILLYIQNGELKGLRWTIVHFD